MQNRTAGFTLLEALVVLVITSLVSVVMVQGFGLMLAARTSVETKLVEADQFILQSSLLLEPLRGVVPDYAERPNVFAGAARTLHGLTVRPLRERPGSPVGFAMTLDYKADSDETLVTYTEQGSPPVVIGRWPGNAGAFFYRDRTGGWASVWPPPAAVPNDTVQTPWLIRLEIGGDAASSLIASVNGAHRRAQRLMDSPFATPPA